MIGATHFVSVWVNRYESRINHFKLPIHLIGVHKRTIDSAKGKLLYTLYIKPKI